MPSHPRWPAPTGGMAFTDEEIEDLADTSYGRLVGIFAVVASVSPMSILRTMFSTSTMSSRAHRRRQRRWTAPVWARTIQTANTFRMA